MLFAHDTELALAAAAALVNTAGEPDGLEGAADLDAFAAQWHWSGSRTRDAAELDAVRALRPRLRALWSGDVEAVAAAVNALLVEGRALPQLVRHDGWPHHLHATSPEQPLADRMMVEAAMAVVDVVRTGELDRLRRCEAEGCDDVLVDLSRNRSRRYCGTACANRVNVAAYRARARAGPR